MTPKIVATLLLLASAQAFVPSSIVSRPVLTSLEGQKQSFLYTGGAGGSSLVSEGRVDIDAPWGSNNPNLHQSRAYHHRRVQKRPGGEGPPPPGTTGGAYGSTFVSDVIEKDSLYGSNYHRAQQYRSSMPRSMLPRNEPALPPPQEETSRAQAPPQQRRQRAEQQAAPRPRQMQAN